MIDLQQSRRPWAETEAAIAQDYAEHAETIANFHKAFYNSRQTHGMTYYEGVPILKNPLDLWVIQEILWDLKPTLLIETGTAFGGSALFYARQMDRYDPTGACKVVSIDLQAADILPQHERITYLPGNSVAPEMIDAIAQCCYTHPRVMVCLDSDHSKDHVLRELDEYSPFVSDGQFLVVEDTNINGRPVEIDWKGGPGPGPAVDEWLPKHPDFKEAAMAKRYLMSFHTFLRREHARQSA